MQRAQESVISQTPSCSFSLDLQKVSVSNTAFFFYFLIILFHSLDSLKPDKSDRSFFIYLLLLLLNFLIFARDRVTQAHYCTFPRSTRHVTCAGPISATALKP